MSKHNSPFLPSIENGPKQSIREEMIVLVAMNDELTARRTVPLDEISEYVARPTVVLITRLQDASINLPIAVGTERRVVEL
jgi:hypothetical protein